MIKFEIVKEKEVAEMIISEHPDLNLKEPIHIQIRYAAQDNTWWADVMNDLPDFAGSSMGAACDSLPEVIQEVIDGLKKYFPVVDSPGECQK